MTFTNETETYTMKQGGLVEVGKRTVINTNLITRLLKHPSADETKELTHNISIYLEGRKIPLILTFNEEENRDRTYDSLKQYIPDKMQVGDNEILNAKYITTLSKEKEGDQYRVVISMTDIELGTQFGYSTEKQQEEMYQYLKYGEVGHQDVTK